MKTRHVWRVVLPLVSAIFAGCGGGGGGGNGGGNQATLAGAVSFPSAGNVVAKHVSLNTQTDTDITVEVRKLDGTLAVPAVHPTSDHDLATAQRIYSYSVAGLTPGVDYVIKVVRGTQVLKKLVEKKDVTAGTITGQSVDATSTAAVVIASLKLTGNGPTVSLGDPLPTGTTVASISSSIANDIKPALLEGSIGATVSGGRTSLTPTTAGYANVYNLVVVAVSDPTVGDAAKVLQGTANVNNVPFFPADNPTVPTFRNFTSGTTTTSVVSSTAATWTAPAETASTYINYAKGYLAAQDIANANINYQKALAVAPNNGEANIGYGITSGIMMLDDPDVKNILAKWGVIYPTVTQVAQGTSPIKLPFSNLTSLQLGNGATRNSGGSLGKTTAAATAVPGSAARLISAFATLKETLPQQKTGFKSVAKELGLAPVSAPTVSEMQTVISNVIIPKLDKILACLQIAESQSASFTVTAAMQGNQYGSDVVVGSGELYTLDGALNLFQVLFEIATAYNFDLPAGYTYNTIAQDPLAMINAPNVFTLKSGGATKMNQGLTYAKTAVAKAKLAFDILKTRTTGFYLVGWTSQDKLDFSQALDNITAALNGPVDLTVQGSTLRVDASKFFTNPLTRANFPTFAYDVPRDAALSAKYGHPVAAERTYGTPNYSYTNTIDCSIAPTSDIPDYKVNGILPNNSAAANVAGFNGILPMISGKVLTPNNTWLYSGTSDGSSIYAIASNYGMYGPDLTKIDPATGAATSYTAAASSSVGLAKLFWLGNQLYNFGYSYETINGNWTQIPQISPVTLSGTTYTTGAATTIPLDVAYGAWPSAVTASGADLYVALNRWDQFTYTSSTEVHKISNLLTAPTDQLLFTVSEDISLLAVSGGNLYTDGQKRSLSSPATVIATYTGPDFYSAVFMGGSFYTYYGGKLIKYAGTPSGGNAKLAAF